MDCIQHVSALTNCPYQNHPVVCCWYFPSAFGLLFQLQGYPGFHPSEKCIFNKLKLLCFFVFTCTPPLQTLRPPHVPSVQEGSDVFLAEVRRRRAHFDESTARSARPARVQTSWSSWVAGSRPPRGWKHEVCWEAQEAREKPPCARPVVLVSIFFWRVWFWRDRVGQK